MTFETDVVIKTGTGGNSLKTDKVLAPTTSGGTTFGTGSSGQILKSNGSNIYWADESSDSAITNNTIDTLFPEEE